MPEQAKVRPDQLYRPDSMDYSEVEERASHGYFRTFWSTYKGHVRGMLAGVAIGVVLGGAIGVAVAGLLGGAGAITASVIAGFAGMGGFLAADAFGGTGSAAASRAAGLAEKHARILDPVHQGNTLSALNDKLMMDGRGHHFQYPEDRDKGKFYEWKSGLLGAAVGTGVGLLLAGTAFASSAALPLAVTMGGFGLTFGIDRSRLKSIFNQVDANTRGEVRTEMQGPDLGRAQFTALEGDRQLEQHRLSRQESISILEEKYHSKIMDSAVDGLFRGLAGGVVAGALIGAAVGAVAFGGAVLLGATAVTELGLASVTAAMAGGGALYGMKAFADAGREAGAESAARAIDNEFDREQQLRARGIVVEPKPEEKGKYFNVKSALLMAAVGAGVGLLIPGVLGVEAVGLAHAACSSIYAASAIVGGMVGGMYGVGSESTKTVSAATDWLYDKTYIKHNDPTAAPYIAAENTPAAPSPSAPDTLAPQHAATVSYEDASRLQERIQQRPHRSFEQTVLAQQNNPSLSPSL